jgi:uncharacterized protein (DUF58 family)
MRIWIFSLRSALRALFFGLLVALLAFALLHLGTSYLLLIGLLVVALYRALSFAQTPLATIPSPLMKPSLSSGVNPRSFRSF